MNRYLKMAMKLATVIGLCAPAAMFGDGIAGLDFVIAVPTPGRITYNGGRHGGARNPLVGKNIEVDSVEGINTFHNNKVTLNLIGGLLNFTSGDFTDTNHPPPITVIENIPTKVSTTTTVFVKQCDKSGRNCTTVPKSVTTTKTVLVPTPVLVPQAPTEWIFGSPSDALSKSDLALTSILLTAQCVDIDRDDSQPSNGNSIPTTKCDSGDLLGPLDPHNKTHTKHLPITLLTGGWEDATVESLVSNFKVVSGSFDDTLSSRLVHFYAPDMKVPLVFTMEGNLNLSFVTKPKPPFSFTSNSVLSGGVTSQLPEPASLALIGTGLVGLAGMVRRKLFS